MLEERILRFHVEGEAGDDSLAFSARRLICAGFSGRSQDALQAHVKELAQLDHPVPESTPIFFQVSHYLATTATEITVQDRLTSGEVEFVLLFDQGQTWVTCGSDHTHRDMERYSIPAAKQMHSKVLAPVAWRLSEVEDHWDDLILRAWSTRDGVRTLYQEGPLADILMPGQLFQEAADRNLSIKTDGTVFMSGTIATTNGLVYADRLEFELHDPVRRRTIRHLYDVSLLK